MAEKQLQEKKPSGFIPEFEGLRGILAAWVVLGHILLLSGFEYSDGWFGILFSPVLGVYAFMILSGFVISATLDRKPTSWFAFMKRRFFRIFPIYIFCLVVAIILLPMSVSVSQSAVMQQFGPENMARLDNVNQNFGSYFLVDLTLLQGLMPQTWYPYASETFLPPTWSLTLEWMFYLVAPFVIWAIKKRSTFGLALLVSIFLSLIFFSEFFAAWNKSFNFNNACYFLTGIFSYYLWKLTPFIQNSIPAKVFFWGIAIVTFATLHLPFKIWIVMMVLLLYSRFHKNEMLVLEWIRGVFCVRSTQFLGRTSYVTYLFHWITIELVLFWISQMSPDLTNKYALAAILIATVYPITYLISDVVSKRLELPMIQIGKRGFQWPWFRFQQPS